MKKNYFLLLFAFLCLAGKNYAQTTTISRCATDEVRQQQILQHPEILKYEAQLEKEIGEKLKGIDYSKLKRTTDTRDMSDSVDFWYDIPIVVHIIHNYGPEFLTDDSIMNAFKDWNIVYAKENADTSSVIEPFKGFINNSNKRYIGNPHIRLHFATKDPNGNPSRGITRQRSYLTYIGGEPSKLDDWPPSSYVNIWSVNLMTMGPVGAAAYAEPPGSGAANPNGDGIITLYDYFRNGYDGQPNAVSKTINHEMGHVFNLAHPWGNTNNPQVALGDDNVDDTPPTWGHYGGGCFYGPSSNDNSLYDTLYATNYFKVYPAAGGGDSVVNYPDTTNTQNIMDYTYCSRMFTYGQVARMHAALNSDVGGRNNLWNPHNLILTGVWNADSTAVTFPDYKPIPEFSAIPTNAAVTSFTNYKTRLNYFTFPGVDIKFENKTWNDTVTNLIWAFTNTPANATITQSTTAAIAGGVTNHFADGGWVTLSMTASGNHTGDTTVTWPHAVFVASPTATSADGYVQDFSSADTANFPMFNYYNNNFKWQWANTLYDNTSLQYVSFDSRVNLADNILPLTGVPSGDVDDFFTVPYDLSTFSGTTCYLNYNYTGASRSAGSAGSTDTMEIDYATKTSTGGMSPWTKLTIISKGGLNNKGVVNTYYTPASASDWASMGVSLPPAAKTAYTVFRFRYLPGNSVTSYGVFGSSNNFYMDRLSFSQWPAYVNNVKMGNVDVAVVPNPTEGDAYVVVKDADNTEAQVIVTDVTGKMVYKTSEQITGNQARILIPKSAISVSGMYIVQTITGNQAHTQKLIVE